MIPALLAIIIAFSIMGTAIIEVTITNFTVVGNIVKSQQAFNIAEAGLNYYMWHLNHNNTDYKDGGTIPSTPNATLGYGPYTHDYIDSNGVNQGTYTLWIKPAGPGSTIVTVRSIGQATSSGMKRTVQAQIGSPSFASYGVVSDSALWFGSTESADGPVASNQGVRMDGASNSTVSAANGTYVPASSVGGNGSTSHPGVWCDTSITTPVNCNTRSKSAWIYPTPAIDFNQVSTSLCTMKKVAFADYSATASLATQSNACSQVPSTRTNAYVPQLATTFSTTKGYLIKLNSNNTYDLLKVNSEDDTKTPYTNALGTTSVATSIPIPTSGVIFVEDNVWVLTPTTFSGRVTIASGRLASSTNNTDIVIADDILYSTKNGNDSIGLVAEDSVILAPYAPPGSGAFNFEVDAAVLAQTGDVLYPSTYRTGGGGTRLWSAANQTFTFYGSVATRQTWTWTWCSGNPCNTVSGIANNNTQYDFNLEYSPPPSYPITAGYNILSWREILTHP